MDSPDPHFREVFNNRADLSIRPDLSPHEKIRQPGNEGRENRDKKQHGEQGYNERQRGTDDPLEGQAGDPGHDKEDHAEGWGQEADHQIEDHDQAEMERVDTHLGNDRHEHRSDDQNRHHGFHETADDQQEEIDDQEQGKGVGGESADTSGDLDRQAGAQEQPAEEVGCADDDADGSSLPGRGD